MKINKEKGNYMSEVVKRINRIPKVKRKYNAKEFFEFVKDKEERYELIDGEIHMMASPSVGHQDINGYIYRKLGNYLEGRRCRVFISPLDVILFEKNKTKEEQENINKRGKNQKDDAQNVFQPDVFVVCSPKKISKNRINGAPDFVIEVLSPSNAENDYGYKLGAYMKYGVKEYWIVDPETKKILVYIKNKKRLSVNNFTFEDKIKISIFDDFEIDFKLLDL